MLFQADMGKQYAEQVRRTFWAEHGTASAEVRGFADDLFRVATDRSGEIDGLIERHAEHWRMERMAAVDRNLLRAAVAELIAYPDTPRAVVINEALEIAQNWTNIRWRCRRAASSALFPGCAAGLSRNGPAGTSRCAFR